MISLCLLAEACKILLLSQVISLVWLTEALTLFSSSTFKPSWSETTLSLAKWMLSDLQQILRVHSSAAVHHIMVHNQIAYICLLENNRT